jgi:hypothetical protein
MSVEQATRRLRLWSILVIIGVFLAGAIAGAGVFAWLRPAPPWRPRRGDLPALFNELDLTPDQREKVTAIFEKHRAASWAIIQGNFPRVRAEQEQSNREIRAILTDAQIKKLDEIESRPRPPHHRGGMGWGPPPPGDAGERQPGGHVPAPRERLPPGETRDDHPAPQPR